MYTCRGNTEGKHKIMEENMHAETRKKCRHGEEVLYTRRRGAHVSVE